MFRNFNNYNGISVILKVQWHQSKQSASVKYVAVQCSGARPYLFINLSVVCGLCLRVHFSSHWAGAARLHRQDGSPSHTQYVH